MRITRAGLFFVCAIMISSLLTFACAEGEKRIRYFDQNTGISFLLPEGWIQTELSKERAYFAPERNIDAVAMLYSIEDIWAQMDEMTDHYLTQQGITRQLYDKFAGCSTADIAEVYGISADEVWIDEINGIQFFCCETKQMRNVQQMRIEFDCNYVNAFKNGYWISFQLLGPLNNDRYYPDFVEVLESIKWN